jgi:hypothetical protein
VAQGIAAAGTEFAADDIGAKPVAVSFANRIDALHGAAGQKLHKFFSADGLLACCLPPPKQNP